MKNRKQREYLEKYKSIIANRKTGHVLLACVLAGGLSACGVQSTMFGGSDIQISATESGMRAYGDHLSAIITNAKAPEDAIDTPAYQLRREQNLGRVQIHEIRYGKKIKGGK